MPQHPDGSHGKGSHTGTNPTTEDELAKSNQEHMARMYGSEFPGLKDPKWKEMTAQEKGSAWLAWAGDRISEQRGEAADRKLHYARHRLFRQGLQWISTRDNRKWRESDSSNNRIRAVFNMVGPALDFRLSLLREQQPGWRYESIAGGGTAGRETAEAQQSVVEYVFKTEKMWRLVQSGAAEAQTDGISWLEVFIDKTAGPQIERVLRIGKADERYKGHKAAGHRVGADGRLEIPLGGTGEPLGKNDKPGTFTGGKISTRVINAHETWVDPEALSINGPGQKAKWFIIRRPRDIRSARLETGVQELESDDSARHMDLLDLASDAALMGVQRGIPAFPQHGSYRGGHNTGNLVWEYKIYIAGDSKGIGKGGKWIRIIADRLIKDGPLPEGRIPMVRITDGSPDVGMYLRPEMSDWIGDQLVINALGSKIIEHARTHSGSRLLALQGTTIKETWNNIVGSITEYQGPKPEVMNMPQASSDTWNFFQTAIGILEDKTGWTDLARGKVAGDASNFEDISGRAVLGAREMFERQFGPMVRATADAMTDWADLVLVYARFLYSVPRLIPMAGRPDLAKRIDRTMLGDQSVVSVDPETLMPLPRALRNQMLFDHLKEGLITPREYQKRSSFAEIRNLGMGEADQWNRAQWINTLLEEGWEEYFDMDPLDLYGPDSGILVFWQDDSNSHMSALEELILDERKPWKLRKIAADRWGIYSELGKSKDFPPELEQQGAPRPPAPLEVMGVPNDVLQQTEPSTQQITGQTPPGTGAQPAALAAPETAPEGPGAANTDAAQPIGSFGREEQTINR